MEYAFDCCRSLITAPVIPATVTNVHQLFNWCTSLEGTIVINANPEIYESCFSSIDFEMQNITLTGESAMLDTLGATGENYCAECNGKCAGHLTLQH